MRTAILAVAIAASAGCASARPEDADTPPRGWSKPGMTRKSFADDQMKIRLQLHREGRSLYLTKMEGGYNGLFVDDEEMIRGLRALGYAEVDSSGCAEWQIYPR